MAACRGVYDSRHTRADYKEPGSAPEPYARQSSSLWAIPYTPSEVPSDFSVVVRASGACLPSADSHTHDTLVGLRFIISVFADALTTPTITYFVAASLCNSKLPVTLYTGRI